MTAPQAIQPARADLAGVFVTNVSKKTGICYRFAGGLKPFLKAFLILGVYNGDTIRKEWV